MHEFILYHYFLLSSSTRMRFYPQGSSGQAVVTGVFPFSRPVRTFIFVAHRVQHSHFSAFHARRFSLDFASSCSRAFRYS